MTSMEVSPMPVTCSAQSHAPLEARLATAAKVSKFTPAQRGTGGRDQEGQGLQGGLFGG